MLSRRTFLRGSALASASVVFNNAALAAEEAAASKPAFPIRWGLIGTGKRAHAAHIPAIKSFPEFEIVAACDVREDHLARGLKEIGGNARGYADYQKLLANDDVEAVLIATPNLWHKEMVIAALQAGKHVMCEKPMAVMFDECKAMRAAADARPDRVVLYAMQLRYAPRYVELRRLIESGKIGKPKYFFFAEFRGDWAGGDVWKYTDPRTDRLVNWRHSHAASGGTLNEKVCHYFDILHWLAGGVPQRVLCSGGISVYRDGRDTWDHASTTLEYAGGAKAIHGLCMFGPNRLDLEVIGEEGSLRLAEEGLTLSPRKGKTEPLPLPDEVGHGQRRRGTETAVVRMYEDFAGCARNGKRPWMDAEKAMASSKTAWLGELSNERKAQVGWDAIS